MNFLLQVIFCGLFANSVFSALATNNKVKRHVWRGSPISHTVEPSRNIETKGGRSNPASLHHTLSSNCTPHENGIKPHPNNCQMYISCWNGIATTDTCSDGFLYNDATKECDFASKVACSTVSGQSARLYAPQDDSFHDTSEYTDTDQNVVNDFKCSREGIFEHPHDCTKFIQCAHSGLYIQSCGPGTMFNPSLLVCDWPKNVNCKKNVNANILSHTSNQDSRFVHSQGQETRPDDDVYDFDVRMTDMNSRSDNINNREQHSRVYSTSSIQNAQTQSNQRRSDDSRQTDSLYSQGTVEYSRTGQRAFQLQPETSRHTTQSTSQYPDQTSFQNSPQGSSQNSPQGSSQNSPQGSSQYSAQGSSQYSPQGSSQYSPQGSSQNSPQGSSQYSSQGSSQYSPQGSSQNSPQGSFQYSPQGTSQNSLQGSSQYSPQGSSQYSPQGSSQYSPQGSSQYSPQGSSQNSPQGSSQYSSQGSSQYSPQGSSQNSPQGSFQYSPQASSQNSPQGSSQNSAQGSSQNSLKGSSQYSPQTSSQNSPQGSSHPQSNPQYPSQTSHQYPSQSNSQYPSQTNLQHPQQTRSQYPSQQYGSNQGTSQSRSFQSEPNLSPNKEIITSVLPLHSPSTQHNGNVVHSAPSYSKTKVYSAQQTYPHHTGLKPNLTTSSLPQYDDPYEGSLDLGQREQFNNFDETMDLLDTYTNIGSPRRHDTRTNVMTVERANSNRDHEIPIYNRPQNMRFAIRFSDDMQPQPTENVLPMNDALKLMLSSYTKSAPFKNDNVNEITTKLLRAARTNGDAIAATSDGSNIFEAETIVRNDDVIVKEGPNTNFTTINSENSRQYVNQRNSFTPTPDTEIIPDFASTKIGRFPARTNSLLNNDEKKYQGLNQPIYRSEVIELFCTTGFDCGNGVCLSSEKMCDGRDDCGNRKDEQSCKHIGYEIRLSGDGDRPNTGRIEVKVFDKWGHICDDRFGLNEANVLCREAGFALGAVEVNTKAAHMNLSSIDNSPRFGMAELRCSGNETSLKECNFNGWDERDCNSEEIVGVVCKLPDMKCQLNYWLCDQSEECIPTAFLCDAVSDCSDGSDENAFHCNSSIQYRLGNPKSNHKEGRVEVRYKGIWGTVCDDDFGENEAKVFCRSLGYDGAAAVIKEFAEPGEGLIWLDQVSCLGNETSLEKCSHFEWGENNCNHTEDVSVRCLERQVETHQKLIMRERKSGFAQLNEIQDRSKSGQEHCGQIRVSDEPDDYDDQPVFKVIEGREAKRGHHPWQATIRVRGRNGKSSHWCGAVLISKTHVLTAAHCVIGFSKNGYFIRLGDHHSEVSEDTEVEVFIEDWHIHEKFRNGHLMNNDIALIKLKAPVKFTDYIQPICLPTEETQYTAGKNCSISGWGSIQYGRSTPSLQLRSAYIPIMSQEICKQPNNYGSSIQSGMFCAGIPDNMIDACDGDSGGPFVCAENGENSENGYHSLYGLISWGQRCGDRHKPGVYTKVAEYLPWIQQKLLL